MPPGQEGRFRGRRASLLASQPCIPAPGRRRVPARRKQAPGPFQRSRDRPDLQPLLHRRRTGRRRGLERCNGTSRKINSVSLFRTRDELQFGREVFDSVSNKEDSPLEPADIHAFFDESGTHAGSEVMCVAGYLFNNEQLLRFNDEWSGALARYNLRAFHMTDCAQGRGEFLALTPKDRNDLARHLIGIIRRRIRIGIAVSVIPREFAEFAGRFGRDGAYLICLQWCLCGVAAWVARYSVRGRIRFVFESGHSRQGKPTNRLHVLSRANELLSDFNTTVTHSD